MSLIANGKGMFLQFGGRTALSGGKVNKVGPGYSVRVSDSGGVSEGWGYQWDFGMYSRSWDLQGNVSNEYGFGVPGFSQQATYTWRFYNGNCSN